MKYSIVIVTRNSAEDLPLCLESIVMCSGGEDYEVIIVDNASSDESDQLFRMLEGDVKVIRNPMNAGFARAINQGISSSKGEYIVLLNPDTAVTKGWLNKMSRQFNTSGTGAVGPLSNYVAGGQKFQLYVNDFQSDSIDDIGLKLEREYNGCAIETKLLIGFCMMIPRSVIDKVGMLDDDLILGNDDLEYSYRLRREGYQLEIVLDTYVYHKGQTSFDKENDPDRWVKFSERILNTKLRRELQIVDQKTLWGIDWFEPNEQPFVDGVSIIIPTFNGLTYTKKCLASIRKNTVHSYQLIVVDNGSSDGSVEYLKKQDDVILLTNKSNQGFPAACNQGIEKASYPYILLLNNDVIVTEMWLSRMMGGFFADPQVVMVGPRSNDSAGNQKVSAPDFGNIDELESFATKFKSASNRQFRETDYLSGFCLLIDKRLIEQVGLLDERFGIGNYEDEDLCRRAKASGFKMLVANEVYIHHFGSQSFIENGISYREVLEENRIKYEGKWAEALL